MSMRFDKREIYRIFHIPLRMLRDRFSNYAVAKALQDNVDRDIRKLVSQCCCTELPHRSNCPFGTPGRPSDYSSEEQGEGECDGS